MFPKKKDKIVQKSKKITFQNWHRDIWTPGHYDTWHNFSTLGFIAQILINSQKSYFDHHNADNTSFTMVTSRFL